MLIVSPAGLGWTENAADYSRYLPRDTPKAKTFWAATLGGAIPSILLELLGATAYLVSPKVTAATGVPTAFASWFFWPFVILALPQLFAINTIDMYSSGVTLQAIGIPLKRWGCVLIDTIISGAVTALVIFKGNFYTDLSGFLDYIVVWLGPWFGILMVDYLLRRGRYDVTSLAAKRGGLYWRNGGFNWKALVALATGMFAAMMWIDAAFYVPSYTSYISNAHPRRRLQLALRVGCRRRRLLGPVRVEHPQGDTAHVGAGGGAAYVAGLKVEVSSPKNSSV